MHFIKVNELKLTQVELFSIFKSEHVLKGQKFSKVRFHVFAALSVMKLTCGVQMHKSVFPTKNDNNGFNFSSTG